MRTLIWYLSLFLLCVLLYLCYICYSTGYFRAVDSYFAGEVHDLIPLPGVEDMQMIYSDSLLLLSSDNRAARREGSPEQGHLYLLDLRETPWTRHCLTSELDFPFFPHGISLISSGGGTHRVYAINHVNDSHSIEFFELFGDSLVHRETLRDSSMLSPNDIVALRDGRFYFTNDHGYTSGLGKLAEDYLGLAAGNVIYYDGQTYREAAKGIAYANGINYDPDRQLLFVASPRNFLVKVYERAADGQLSYLEDIDCGTGVDNIEFGPEGKLWIGCHPNLLAFAAYARGERDYAPSEVITIDYRSPGDYRLASVYREDGQTMAAATVAIPWADYLFVGNVMDSAFLVLKRTADN